MLHEEMTMAALNLYTKEEMFQRVAKKQAKKTQKMRQHFFNQYGPINQSQRQALSIKGMRVWLLQGPQLVKSGLLVEDIFLKISACLLSLPPNQTKELYLAIHNKLFNDVKIGINKKNIGFFCIFKNEKKTEVKQAKNRYEYRKLLEIR